jgi:hypothetical protein
MKLKIGQQFAKNCILDKLFAINTTKNDQSTCWKQKKTVEKVNKVLIKNWKRKSEEMLGTKKKTFQNWRLDQDKFTDLIKCQKNIVLQGKNLWKVFTTSSIMTFISVTNTTLLKFIPIFT